MVKRSTFDRVPLAAIDERPPKKAALRIISSEAVKAELLIVKLSPPKESVLDVLFVRLPKTVMVSPPGPEIAVAREMLTSSACAGIGHIVSALNATTNKIRSAFQLARIVSFSLSPR